MMTAKALKATKTLVAEIPLLGDNPTEADHRDALELLAELLMDDPTNPLVDLLCVRIRAYEDNQPKLRALREEIEAIPTGIAILRTLMEQHKLTLSDFADEIGSKSMVSRVLSGQRKLTLDHVKKLAARFGISPALFID
ncbi:MULTISPECIES: helix-turn-helix domain-containing protein [Enterobacteriaceae]|nr:MULTISPECIES: helix-turn-helix domain-containing protein [Enterobacteriaceae]